MKRIILRIVFVIGFCLSIRSPSVAADGNHTVRFEGAGCREIVFSHDGKRLAASTTRGILTLINAETGEVQREYGFYPFAIGFSKSGKRLCGVSEQGRILIDLETGKAELLTSSVPAGYVGVELEQRNGKLLISSITPEGPLAKVSQVQVGDELLGVGHGTAITSVVGMTDEQAYKLLHGPARTSVRLEIVHRGKFTSQSYTVPREFAKTRNGKLVFGSDWKPSLDEKLVMFRLSQGFVFSDAAAGSIATWCQPESLVEDGGVFALSFDQRRFALLNSTKDLRKTAIEVFDLEKQSTEALLDFPKEYYREIKFSHDNSRLFVSSSAGIDVVDLCHDRPKRSLTGNHKSAETAAIQALGAALFGGTTASPAGANNSGNGTGITLVPTTMAVSPQGWLAAGTEDGSVKLLDPNRDANWVVATVEGSGKRPVERICFSANGATIAFFSNGTLHWMPVSDLKLPALAKAK